VLEIFYLSVAFLAAYQAYLFLRYAGPAQRAYAYMLIADGVLAGVAYAAGQRGDGGTLSELLGGLALFGFACLVPIPLLLRGAAGWALSREHVRLAVWLTGLRELLQPGLGARQDRDHVEASGDARSGRADEVVAALTARRGATHDPVVRQAIDDRIVLTLLYAARWRQAIEVFERALGGGALPTSLQLLVEMIRAYGEEGQHDKAADLIDRLEHAPQAHEPALSFLFSRARLLFLSLVGRAEAVTALVARTGPLAQLSPAARAYWVGTARLQAGDRDGARAALAEAVRASPRDTPAQRAAAQRLASVDDAALVVPPALSPPVTALADRLSAQVLATPPAEILPSLQGGANRRMPVTWALIALNVLAFALVTSRLGSTTDPAVLVRAGANLKAAVRAGDWWRLLTAMFLHIGFLHLAINMLALWRLGQLVEHSFGSVRFFAIYLVSGLGGSLASLIFGQPGVSAGASGAVMGVLGGAIADLVLRRKSQVYLRWRRLLLGNLMFVAIAQILIGVASDMIDQAAHVGGLLTGALLAAPLSRATGVGKTLAARVLAAALAAASLAVLGYSAWAAATSSYSATFARAGWAEHTVQGVALELPRMWIVGEASALDLTWATGPREATLDVRLVPRRQADEDIAGERAKLVEAGHVSAISEVTPSFTVGGAWRVHELRLRYEEDHRPELFRDVVFMRAEGVSQAIQLSFVIPERRLPEARAIVERIVSSAHLAAPP
jgi:membrane associated rhomboid family serine protease